MRKTFLILLTIIILPSINVAAGNDYDKLNRQAAKEYLSPVRRGGVEGRPYWNGLAKRFIYAPAFDFQRVEGAVKYRFVVTSDSGESWTFTAKTPDSSLAPIWNDIAVGQVNLKVEALDRTGKVSDVVGERSFVRDYPFEGPYAGACRPYRESALLCLVRIHRRGDVQYWLRHQVPDMSMQLYTYPCKIVSGLIRMELILAEMAPGYREDAIRIAENAAAFLVSLSAGPDSPLAYLVPTYYKDLITSGKEENVGKMMLQDPAMAAHAFLDLYNATGKQEYFDRAMNMSRTFVRLQRSDGSFPIKVDFQTGKPTNDVSGNPVELLALWHRLSSEYGVKEFEEVEERTAKWIDDVVVQDFNWTGQFEDVSVNGLAPYQNLTHCWADLYVSYLMSKRGADKDAVALAKEINRFCEDQFVHWREDIPMAHPNQDGLSSMTVTLSPNVHEQYSYEMAIDASACGMINAWLDIYERTGDALVLEKAYTMADSIVNSQITSSGLIPTSWNYHNGINDRPWYNCTLWSIQTLLRLDASYGNHIRK